MLINEELNRRNISMYEISKRSGVPYMTVNDIVNGVTPVDKTESGTLYRICSSADISMESLLSYSKERLDRTVPEKFRPFFWDTDMDRLSLRDNAMFIISRLLTKGGTEGIRYIYSVYTPREIRNTVCRSRSLTPLVANYYRRIYRLKKEDMRYYQMGADRGWR